MYTHICMNIYTYTHIYTSTQHVCITDPRDSSEIAQRRQPLRQVHTCSHEYTDIDIFMRHGPTRSDWGSPASAAAARLRAENCSSAS